MLYSHEHCTFFIFPVALQLTFLYNTIKIHLKYFMNSLTMRSIGRRVCVPRLPWIALTAGLATLYFSVSAGSFRYIALSFRSHIVDNNE